MNLAFEGFIISMCAYDVYTGEAAWDGTVEVSGQFYGADSLLQLYVSSRGRI